MAGGLSGSLGCSNTPGAFTIWIEHWSQLRDKQHKGIEGMTKNALDKGKVL